MPVPMSEFVKAQSNPSGYAVDRLVKHLRDKLCLKNQDKINAARRSKPYDDTTRERSVFVLEPVTRSAESLHCLNPNDNTTMKRVRRKHCTNSRKYKHSESANTQEENVRLLKKLVSERRLIEEAVRRISCCEYQDFDPGTTDPTNMELSPQSQCISKPNVSGSHSPVQRPFSTTYLHNRHQASR